MSKNETINFLDYLFNEWIVQSYDNGKLNNFRQLLDAKEKKLNSFENDYQNTINNFDNHLLQGIKDWETIYNSLFFQVLNTQLTTFSEKIELNSINDFDNSQKKLVLKNTLDLILGILMIPGEEKSFIAYFLIKIF